MKRSFQEIIELVIFGLIALLVGTGVLWLAGWLLGFVGIAFKFISGILWLLLRFIIPIALVVGVIFFLVRLVMNPRKQEPVVAKAEPEAKTLSDESVSNVSEIEEPKVQEAEVVAEETSDGDEEGVKKPVKEEASTEATAPEDKVGGVDTDVDTSGFKEMDDLAEDLEDEDKA